MLSDVISDRVALVTGASGGLGMATALELSKRGFVVAVAARREQNLVDVEARIRAQGCSGLAVVCDVADAASLAVGIDQVIDRFGRLDVVVANAGISPVVRRAHQLDDETWKQVISTNLTGVFNTAKLAHRHLATSGSGRFIAISSAVTRTPIAGISAYVAAKAGVEGFVRALSVDWAADHITANCVAPGFFESEMSAGLRRSSSHREAIERRTLAQRFGTQHEVADAIAFLASPTSSFITGQSLVVDGGYTVAGQEVGERL